MKYVTTLNKIQGQQIFTEWCQFIKVKLIQTSTASQIRRPRIIRGLRPLKPPGGSAPYNPQGAAPPNPHKTTKLALPTTNRQKTTNLQKLTTTATKPQLTHKTTN